MAKTAKTTSFKEQILTIFQSPVTSPTYIKAQANHSELPTFHELMQHYKDWNEVTQVVWGVKGRLHQWSRSECVEAIQNYCKEPLSSHQYQQLRKSGELYPGTLPPFSQLVKEFGSWNNVHQQVWQKDRPIQPEWQNIELIKAQVLKILPDAVNSSEYQRVRRNVPKGTLPSKDTLLKHYKNWGGVLKGIWKVEKKVWSKESLTQELKTIFPERISRETYQQQKDRFDLPAISTIEAFFESWKSLSEVVWGQQLELTTDLALQQLQKGLERPIAQTAYEKKRLDCPELPSVFQLKHRFGSYQHAMRLAFPKQAKQLQAEPRYLNQYEDQQLIKVVRDYFEEPPTIQDYQKKSNRHKFLPSKNTLIQRFGSWTTVLETCFPEVEINSYKRWEKAELLVALQQAYTEQGSNLTVKQYLEWYQQNPSKRPSLSTINKQLGGLTQALTQMREDAHYPQQIKGDELTKEEVEHYLKLFFEKCEQQNERPSSVQYKHFCQKTSKAPSLSRIRRFYPTWNEALKAFGHDLYKATAYRFSEQDLIDSLQEVVAIIGLPLTQERYIAYTQSAEKHYPSINAYRCRFGTWRKSLVKADISSLSRRTTTGLAQLQIENLKQCQPDTKLNLNTLLDWCLG